MIKLKKIVTKLKKEIMTKIKKLYKNWKLKLCQNLTQIVIVVIVTVVTVVVIGTSCSKNNLTPQQQMKFSLGSFRDSCDVYEGTG